MRRGLLRIAGVLALLPSGALTARAGTVPTVKLGDGILLIPYATDQVDTGGFVSASPTPQKTGGRAARLRNGFRMNIRDQVELGGIWDFGPAPDGQMRLFEGAATYTGLKHFLFRVGVFKPSFGLESMQAQGDTVFVERSGISTVTRNLAAGIEREAVQAIAYGPRYHAAVAGTAGTSGPGHDGNQRAIVFRFAGLPVKTKSVFLHLGFSGEWVFRPASWNQAAGRSVSFADNPEMQNGDTGSFIKTTSIPARSAGAFGLEAALSWNRLLLQGEAYTITVRTRSPVIQNTLHYSGWYGMATWTLFGQPRRWKSRSGALSAPGCDTRQTLLCHGTGIVELAGRFSRTDLRAPVYSGGDQKIWSAAVNWYPVDIIRMTLQYQYGDISGGRTPERFHAIMSMFQVKF